MSCGGKRRKDDKYQMAENDWDFVLQVCKSQQISILPEIYPDCGGMSRFR